jgi:hypothetical protein
MKNKRHSLTRRHLMSSLGICIALPSLEIFGSTKKATAKAQNFVAIGTELGWHQQSFYPKTDGSEFDMPETLKPIEAHREDFTIFSGLDHKAAHGHSYWSNFLCGKNTKSYSLDQIIADKIGTKSRFSSFQLCSGQFGTAMSFSKQGTPLPSINRPSVFFKKMFITKDDQKFQEYILKSGKSSLDFVLEDAKLLNNKVSSNDRNSLDEYFTALRSVEKRLENKISHLKKPIPKTSYKLPDSDPIAPSEQLESAKLMYDLMALALQNGSSRVLSLKIGGGGPVFTLNGKPLCDGYHGLSHHGNNANKLRDLLLVEKEHMKAFNSFLNQLKTKKDSTGNNLLDSTIVLVGTGMGDASRHANNNLPTLVAGGGFKHGTFIATEQQKTPYLLGDLFVTLQQQLGIQTNQFSNASNNINNLLGAS